MRPRVLIPTMIVLLAALATFFWRQPAPKAVNSDTAHQTIQSGNIPNAATNPVGNTAPAGVLSNTAPPTNQTTSENPKPTTEMIHKYLESLNVPIKFYGKVIDQDGNPLADVSVRGEALHIKVIVPAPDGAEDQIIPVDQKTDSNGRFEIKDVSGRSFDLASIQKDGFEVEPDNCPHVFGTSSGSINDPVIFKMWGTNIHEQLITGEKEFEVLPDGSLHVIDLTKGTIAETGSGDLRVWIQYTNQVTRGQLYDWSAGIEVINGGLLEVPHGTVMYSAPPDSYTPSFRVEQQIKGGQSGEVGDRSFYLLLKDGQEYGRMSINLFAPYGNLHPGLIRLSYAINPTGSRVLR